MIKDWNGLNFNYLHENGDKLIECEDYIPLHLNPYYDEESRISFLKQYNLYSKIRKIEEDKRNDFQKSKDKIEWDINDILTFIEKHNEYINILNRV